MTRQQFCVKTTVGQPHYGTIMTHKTVAILVISAALVTLTACNTVKGIGRDIESVGEAGDRAI